ncbi:hypothetical protein GE09DRAFT_1240150 [Coniochaeta sp. 2T2.1]|nr:hypothetical protein GE09DRAFT_1240150 [Coniochaeta sp. 2T2.1]
MPMLTNRPPWLRRLSHDDSILSETSGLPTGEGLRQMSSYGGPRNQSGKSSCSEEPVLSGSNGVSVKEGGRRRMSASGLNIQFSKDRSLFRSNNNGENDNYYTVTGANAFPVSERKAMCDSHHIRGDQSQSQRCQSGKSQRTLSPDSDSRSLSQPCRSQANRSEKSLHGSRQVTANAMDADRRLAVIRQFSAKQVNETKLQTPQRETTQTSNSPHAALKLHQASIKRHLSQLTSQEMFTALYLRAETGDGNITLGLDGIKPTDVLTGRLLWRPAGADLHNVKNVGFPPQYAKTQARQGDFLIERSLDSFNAICDIRDHLRARKVELRREWLQENAAFAPHLKPQWYDTLDDEGPKRIPSFSGKDKIVAAKAVEAGGLHRLIEWNRMERKVLFARRKPLEGQPNQASRHEYIFINALTGAECSARRIGHAIILPETEELYERLTYFVAHTDIDKCLEPGAKDDARAAGRSRHDRDADQQKENVARAQMVNGRKRVHRDLVVGSESDDGESDANPRGKRTRHLPEPKETDKSADARECHSVEYPESLGYD